WTMRRRSSLESFMYIRYNDDGLGSFLSLQPSLSIMPVSSPCLSPCPPIVLSRLRRSITIGSDRFETHFAPGWGARRHRCQSSQFGRVGIDAVGCRVSLVAGAWAIPTSVYGSAGVYPRCFVVSDGAAHSAILPTEGRRHSSFR